MTKKHVSTSETKTGLHPKNLHRSTYDFNILCECLPELSAFVVTNASPNKTIDFSNALAVKTLNKALLKCYYKIDFWDIPEGYLCPPIPGRSDYIHYMADLLRSTNEGILPNGKSITAFDIGTGANCIYPILGTQLYDWKFIGSDIDPISVKHASAIVEANTNLTNSITIKLQRDKTKFFSNIIKKDDRIDLTFCNPPFHNSSEEAQIGSSKKWQNLGIKKNKNTLLNFGGQNNELWCEGGENTFICNLVKESNDFRSTCFWFSTLISKKTTLPSIYYILEKVGAKEVKTIEMAQGQKISRIVTWTFLTLEERAIWRETHWFKNKL